MWIPSIQISKNEKEERILYDFSYYYSHFNERVYIYPCWNLDWRSTKDLFIMSFVEKKKIGNIYILF